MFAIFQPMHPHSRSPQPFQRLTIAHSFNPSFDLQASITVQRNPTYCLDIRILDIASAGLSFFRRLLPLALLTTGNDRRTVAWAAIVLAAGTPFMRTVVGAVARVDYTTEGQYRILLTMYWNITNMGKWRSVLREALERPRRLD